MGHEQVRKETNIYIAETELPTTPEIAEKGVSLYETVLTGITDTYLQKAFFKIAPNVEKCFLGISPDITFQYLYPNSSDTYVDLSLESVTTLSRLVSRITPDIVLALQQSITPDTKRVFLLNMIASERVIRNHQYFFPQEAIDTPREWLLTHVDEWQQNDTNDPSRRAEDIRYGLLSGYPFWSVVSFQQFQDALITCHQMGLQREDKIFLDDYLQDSRRRTKKQKQKAREILSQTALSPYEQELLITGELITTSSGINFKSFDREQDTAYVDRLEELYKNSGITRITERVRGF